MKRWGLRGSSLSADTKADAGQNVSSKHLYPNVLYMMLATVYLIPVSTFSNIKLNSVGFSIIG